LFACLFVAVAAAAVVVFIIFVVALLKAYRQFFLYHIADHIFDHYYYVFYFTESAKFAEVNRLIRDHVHFPDEVTFFSARCDSIMFRMSLLARFFSSYFHSFISCVFSFCNYLFFLSYEFILYDGSLHFLHPILFAISRPFLILSVLSQLPRAFSTMHYRRNDLQYPRERNVRPDQVFENTRHIFEENETIYVSTDEKPEV
jgi:hypothetical protein